MGKLQPPIAGLLFQQQPTFWSRYLEIDLLNERKLLEKDLLLVSSFVQFIICAALHQFNPCSSCKTFPSIFCQISSKPCWPHQKKICGGLAYYATLTKPQYSKKKEKTRLDTPWIIKCGQEEEEFVIVHSHIFFNINGLFMVVMGNDTQEFNVV